jgi:hypothetical protein
VRGRKKKRKDRPTGDALRGAGRGGYFTRRRPTGDALPGRPIRSPPFPGAEVVDDDEEGVKKMADGTEEGEGGRVLKLNDGLVCVTCDVGPGQCGGQLAGC